MALTWAESYLGRVRTSVGDADTILFVGARGVILDEQHRLLLIQRSDNHRWAIPAGAMELGESMEQCAIREVWEETGLRCTLGEELPPVFYDDRKGRSKAVRYWLMQPADGAFAPNDEVDEMRWMDLEAAAALLTYPHDVELVRAAEARL